MFIFNTFNGIYWTGCNQTATERVRKKRMSRNIWAKIEKFQNRYFLIIVNLITILNYNLVRNIPRMINILFTLALDRCDTVSFLSFALLLSLVFVHKKNKLLSCRLVHGVQLKTFNKRTLVFHVFNCALLISSICTVFFCLLHMCCWWLHHRLKISHTTHVFFSLPNTISNSVCRKNYDLSP